MEYFRVPKDVLVVCVGKSTYARCGIIVNVTPLEPEWCGHLTLEISNTTPLPAKIYSNEGLAQLLFFQGDGGAGGHLRHAQGQVPGPARCDTAEAVVRGRAGSTKLRGRGASAGLFSLVNATDCRRQPPRCGGLVGSAGVAL
jgi:hypothetical protein